MKILGLLAGAALLVGAQGAYAATVTIQNGSFETGTPSNPGNFSGLGFSTETAGSGAINGWSIDGGSVDYIGSYWTAAEGVRSLDLSGTTPGTISQQVLGMHVGQQYTVTFSLRGNGDGGVDPQKLDLTFGGFSRTFEAVKASTSWVLQSFSFIYNGGPDEDILTFAAHSGNGSFGPGLDNVQIAATPIPGAILLFGSALGGLGFLGYRRRKAQAAA